MILRTENLRVGYGARTVVSGVDLAILEGQFVCLLGPNGSGKSTLLKTIIRTLAPLGGEVYLGDRNIARMSSQEMARTTAAVLTQNVTPGLLTAYDIVMLGRYPHTGFMGKPLPADHEKVRHALDLVNAGHLVQRYFNELSDGEKQKALVARALAQEPKLIVLDEPTSHLDARHRIEVMLILRQLTRERGVTVIASLHDVDLAMKACDVAVLVKDEQVLACGTPEDVLREEIVARLYDMERATFSATLGGVELRGGKGSSAKRLPGGDVSATDARDTECFVVAGAGTGAGVYRSLVKHGLGVVTGVLPENDIDSYVASAVGGRVIGSPPYESPTGAVYGEARKAIESVRQVIDAGFPVAKANSGNAALVRQALEMNKIVHTFRTGDQARALYGFLSSRLCYARDFFELMTAVRKAAISHVL